MSNPRALPLVLAIGGHDPSGGAGLQADIEAIAAHGCQALTLVTALTTQNTRGVRRVLPQPAEQLWEQFHLLREDSPLAAIKLGLLGSADLVEALAEVLDACPQVPVVLDPVLGSGTGTPFADEALRAALLERLVPRCGLLTPNAPEARALSGERDLAESAAFLIRHGAGAVLITGTHEPGARVLHQLYTRDGRVIASDWERLPGDYHGSGCTLASACAARLALGQSLPEAVAGALDYTWHSLRHALVTGHCQYTPDRFYRYRVHEN